MKIKEMYLKYKEIIHYLIFGGLTTIVSLLVYCLLVFTILNPQIAWELQVANIASWVAGVTFAYITNRKYVFKSTNESRIREATHFVLARVVTLLLDMAIMWIGVTWLKQNDKIFKCISQIVVIVLNYIFSKVFVFKQEK